MPEKLTAEQQETTETKDKRSFRTSGEHPSVITGLVLNEIQSQSVERLMEPLQPEGKHDHD